MIPTLIYVCLTAGLLQFWQWQQGEAQNGREYPFVFLSASFGIYALFVDIIPIDVLTLSAFGFAIYLVASLFWTDSRMSVFEVMVWLSYLMLFLAARTLPVLYVCLAIFPMGVVIAGWQLYLQITTRKIRSAHDCMNYPPMMNNNHTGVVMVMQVFVGIYLMLNFSLWIFPLVCLIGVAVALSQARASIIAIFPALIVVAFPAWLWGIGLAVLIALTAAIVLFQNKIKNNKLVHLFRLRTLKIRLMYFLAAWYIIRQRPFFGWGMNMFRKKLFDTNGKVYSKEWVKEAMPKMGEGYFHRTHRVHNDHLELIVELGLVGYLLFASLFLQISHSMLFIGVIVAYGVNAFLFFPLREVHSAAPFWAVMGACAGTIPLDMPLPILKIAILCSILALLHRAWKKYLGLCYFDKAAYTNTHVERLPLYEKALEYDPYNGYYLTRAYDSAHLTAKYSKAWELSARVVFNFDGQIVKAGVYDQFGKISLHVTHLNIAKWALEQAVSLEPEQNGSKPLLERVTEYIDTQRINVTQEVTT